MKKITIIITLLVLLISNDSLGYKLIINKTFTSHNPAVGSTYNYKNRDVVYEYNPLDPTVITRKIVNIFCEGNGPEICPNSICIPNDAGNPPQFMTLAAINAAQNMLDAEVNNYETYGTTTNSSGTIGTPDGLYYTYTIAWTTSTVTGETKLQFTLTSVS